MVGIMEEEKENGAFIRLDGDCWGFRHFRPSQADHACCNYGQQEEPEEQETMTVQPFDEDVSIFFVVFSFFLSFFLLSFFSCYVLIFLFPRTVPTR